MGFVTHPLHHGDGKAPGGDDICHGGTRNGTHKAACHNRCLCRPPGHPSRKAVGKIYKEITAPRFFQKGPEKDKDEDKGGRHACRQSPDTLGRQVEGRGDALDGVSLMSEEIGHIGPHIGVDQKDQRNDGHEEPDGPARGLHDQDHGHDAEKDVHSCPISLSLDNGVEFHPDVGADCEGDENQDPVKGQIDIKAIPGGPFCRWIQRKGKDHDQYQVDGALIHGRQG